MLITYYLLTISTKHELMLALTTGLLIITIKYERMLVLVTDLLTITTMGVMTILVAGGESELGFAEMTVLYCFAVHKLLELDLPCYSTSFSQCCLICAIKCYSIIIGILLSTFRLSDMLNLIVVQCWFIPRRHCHTTLCVLHRFMPRWCSLAFLISY